MPPLLLGLPGDNTYANFQEANRAFWRQTAIPLVGRLHKSFAAWLTPAYGPLRFEANLDRIDALAEERALEWRRIGAADFLTLDERRQAAGYGPAPEGFATKRNAALELRYRPDQPRAPAGQSDGGRWVAGGGSGSGVGGNFGVAWLNDASPRRTTMIANGHAPRFILGGTRLAGGFAPEDLGMSVQDFISANCKGYITREIPEQLLSATIKEMLEEAKSGNVAAVKCRKLLIQDRFRK